MKNNTLKEEIVIAINNILSRNKGSKYASLEEIYEEVAKNKKIEVSATLKSEIRGRLQEHSSQYKNYLGKEDLFETKKIYSGLWKNKISGEKFLKKYVFEIIKEFPGIDITNLQKNLLELIKEDLTAADKLESITRPGEMKIEQIIRNFVSHKGSYKNEINFVNEDGVTRLYLKDQIIENLENNNDISDIEESLDDRKRAVVIIETENEKPKTSTSEEKLVMKLERPLSKKKNYNSKKIYIRKSDFNTYINDYHKKLDNGYHAEALVFEYEKDKLASIGRSDLSEKVKWISREAGDGFGYDIQSFEVINGIEMEIFIEVKSTSSSLSSDFEITSNELEFARNHKENYRLYRISRKGNKSVGYIVKGSIEEEFDLKPISYRASIKNLEED